MKYLFILTLMILPLGACGIKPKSVDAPSTAEKPDTFPRSYPAPVQTSK